MTNKKYLIEFRGFSKRYGKIIAVNDINLKIEASETFALLGPNGSGKSTLLRALAGLLRPSSGKVLIDGIESPFISRSPQNVFSYLPQRVSLPEQLTGREILRFFAHLRRVNLVRVEEALKEVELLQDADRPTREYSGGMLQRLGLAIALLQETPLLLLDEPTLNLDPIGMDRFRNRILELKKKGVTIVVSSHIFQDALQLADRVAVLIGGKLIRVEKVEEFQHHIARETSVRVVLEKTDEQVIAAVIKAGVQSPSWNGSHIQFKASSDQRIEVMRAIERAGGKIKEFHTEIPDWDAILGE